MTLLIILSIILIGLGIVLITLALWQQAGVSLCGKASGCDPEEKGSSPLLLILI